LSVVLGYLATLLTETVTYAAAEYGAGTRGEGVALAVVRGDVVLSVGLVAVADRRGRRTIALGCAVAGCLLTALGAAAPSLPWLAASQVLARGFVTAGTIASAVLVAEATPKGARAWAIGVTSMALAVGAGVSVVALPLAGISRGSWRILFVAALGWLPLVAAVGRRLDETDRYRRLRAAIAEASAAERRATARRAIDRSRLLLLGAAYFLLQAFVAPASEFQNEYLRRQRHFSPPRISVFVIVTVLPGAIGIVAGGRLADTRGRRIVTAVAVAGTALFGVALYSLSGWPMWAAGALAAITGAAVAPAMTVYGAELFGTDRRGSANGVLTAVGRAGAVVGLLVVGVRAQGAGRFGPAFALLATGPVVLLLLVVTAFPETARRSLEELNPDDSRF
jgi:MFS family permease